MKKSVCVIGAGPAGLAAMRTLIENEDKVSITTFEQSNVLGGLWVNRDPYKRSSIYDTLRSNIPKELLSYTGFSFPEHITDSYIHHSVILEYLNNFARHYNMHQYIRFRHRVVDVDPYMTELGRERWNVTVINEDSGIMSSHQFDAVMVCNGHETLPYIPELEGIKSYTGEVMHSTYHQNPTQYTDKTVCILGGAVSGKDISLDISKSAKHIYLSHNLDRVTMRLPLNVEERLGIERIDGDDIVLKDGSVIQADMIILATGYRFNLSFINERCRPQVVDEHITRLYRMMISIDCPSLYFIGLNKMAAGNKLFGIQAELAVAFITEKIPPVSKQEMEDEYRELYQRLVVDENKRPKQFHYIQEYQWEYHTILANQSRTNRPVPAVAEKMSNHWFRKVNKSLIHFRDAIYKAVDDENFEIVYEHPALQEEE